MNVNFHFEEKLNYTLEMFLDSTNQHDIDNMKKLSQNASKITIILWKNSNFTTNLIPLFKFTFK